jgi:glycosyltransferase involved in cell wall biosynthesis
MPPSLTIGIDARAAAEIPAGRGRVVRELLSALAARSDDHRYILYCRRRPKRTQVDDRFRWRELAVADPAWALWAAASANRDCDVLLSTNSYLMVCLSHVPSAMIVYDLVPFVPGIPAQRRSRRMERLTLRAAIARTDAVLCVSRSTLDDVIARYPAAEGKTRALPLAAGALFGSPRSQAKLAHARKRYGLPRSFVLSVGTFEPRKNLQRLADAHAGLPDELRINHPLALVGPPGWDNARLMRALAGKDEIRLLGFVDDEDLATLYASSTVFCYPSLYEGFGLPVLEAMQSGTPTIISCVSSLPEVAGDSACYVDPYSVPDIRRALTELLASPTKRTKLARDGRARAAMFSWARTAEQTLTVLKSLAGR